MMCVQITHRKNVKLSSPKRKNSTPNKIISLSRKLNNVRWEIRLLHRKMFPYQKIVDIYLERHVIQPRNPDYFVIKKKEMLKLQALEIGCYRRRICIWRKYSGKSKYSKTRKIGDNNYYYYCC